MRAKTDLQTSDQKCLRLAECAVDCNDGPKEICTAFLTFRSITRPDRTLHASLQLENKGLIENDMKQVASEQSRTKTLFRLKHTNEQIGKETWLELWKTPPGSPGLDYCI